MANNIAHQLETKPDVYLEHGARLDAVVDLLWHRDVCAVPVIGYIEERGWFGPTIIGVCTQRDVAIGVWSRNRRPKHVCIQSVMQRDLFHLYDDESTEPELTRVYAAIIERYRADHGLPATPPAPPTDPLPDPDPAVPAT